jgi:Excalibur calcium-binding domain
MNQPPEMAGFLFLQRQPFCIVSPYCLPKGELMARVAFLVVIITMASTLTNIQAAPKKYGSCGKMNVDFPHGVGLRGAVDRTKDGIPVRNFAIRPDVYKANSGRLDRDKDDIACEKH